MVYVPQTQGIHVLNTTARLLLTYLEEEPAGFDELLSMLVEATDGEREVVRRDLGETLERFVAAGILERRT